MGAKIMLYCFIFSFFFGQERVLTLTDSIRIKADSLYLDPLANTAFYVGEHLRFEINLNILFSITAGYTTMSIPDTVYYKGRSCYHILAITESTSFISNFFTLNDTIESYVDMEYGMTWYYSKRTRESGYYRDLYVHYDHLKEEAHIEIFRYEDEKATKIKSHKKYVTKTAPFTHDILASFYILRTKKIESGYPIQISVNSLNTNYNLVVIINPVQEHSVEAGDFKAFLVKPMIKGEGIINKAKKMRIFISDKNGHIPIEMTTGLAIGSVNVELVEYSGIKEKW